MGRTGRALVAAAAGLALADASIVALALPPLLVELHTTIAGVAAVIGVYALVLAAGVPVARPLVARAAGGGVAGRAVAVGGLLVFAAASLGCAAASSLPMLLALRAVQAAGGAVTLLVAFVALGGSGRLWRAATLVGTAAGPALGGVLTQAFDWRAVFAVQAPVAVAAALAMLRGEPAALPSDATAPAASSGGPPPVDDAPPARQSPSAGAGGLWAAPLAPRPPAAAPGYTAPGQPPPAAPAYAAPAYVAPDEAASVAGSPRGIGSLALVSAAFTAVLFLLVLELIAGFAISPLPAALGVTVLPLAAVGATALPGSPELKAGAGALLIAGGAAALAFLPAPTIGWTIVPQIFAGAGMGLALPALTRERSLGEAATSLSARQAGVVLVLAILAPVATHRLEATTNHAVLQGTAVVLDGKVAPLQKLALVPALLNGVNAQRPRAALRAAVAKQPAARPIAKQLDNVVVAAIRDAFRSSYLIAAALAVLAALLLAPRAVRRPAFALATALAAGCVVVYAVEEQRVAPPAVVLRNPCLPRPLPHTGGLGGALQDEALRQLDSAACRAGSTREELALALADPGRARAFQSRYGVNPRSVGGLLSLLGG